MDIERIRKLTYIVNTVILFIVLGLLVFFCLLDVPFLIYFSIPTIAVYLLGYFLIYKDKLDIYVWMVYLWITLYMGLTTICLGYGFGFHLYCISMIPIVFVTEYLAYKLNRRSLKALYVSLAVCVIYLLSTGYVSNIGPIYERDQSTAKVFWLLNSVIVLGFLIFYANWMIKMIFQTDDKLIEMAHCDKLTGLFNRHYMMSILEIVSENDDGVLAMVDIDYFKRINDTYGHNAGDYILKRLSVILKENSNDAKVSRWGGEEFLIYMPAEQNDRSDIFLRIKEIVEKSEFSFENQIIKFTVTIGVAKHIKGQSLDKWIQEADKNLYFGKNSGRNKVVFENLA